MWKLSSTMEEKRPKCSRCGRNNHTVENCTAKYQDYGTILHNMGEMEEVDYETNNEISTEMATHEVSTEMTTKHEDPRYYSDVLIFIQPDVSSLMDLSNTSSKTVGIPKTWILLDSQSTIDVFCNGELLTQIHKTNATVRIRYNAGMKATNRREQLLGYDWM